MGKLGLKRQMTLVLIEFFEISALFWWGLTFKNWQSFKGSRLGVTTTSGQKYMGFTGVISSPQGFPDSRIFFVDSLR